MVTLRVMILVVYQVELTLTLINSAVGTDEEHDAELEEDQAALDHRQELTGDPLPSMMHFDSLENHIYQCVPSENNVPRYILPDDNFEVLAFPDLFSYG